MPIEKITGIKYTVSTNIKITWKWKKINFSRTQQILIRRFTQKIDQNNKEIIWYTATDYSYSPSKQSKNVKDVGTSTKKSSWWQSRK